MSQDPSTPSPGPRRPPWSAHLRQFSRTSLDRPLEQPPPSPDTVSSNSTVRDMPPSKTPRPDRKCTVTINEAFPRDEVLLNLDILGPECKPGSLMAINIFKAEADKSIHNNLGKQPYQDRSKDVSATGHQKAADSPNRYIFVVKDMPKDLKAKNPTVELYVAKHIADVFGLKKGTQVLLTPVCGFTHLLIRAPAHHI